MKIKRAAQQPLETYNTVVMMTVLSGLKHPILAGTFLMIWTIGSAIYSRNYVLLGPAKRNTGFAPVKYIGLLGLLITSASFTVSLMLASAKKTS